MSRRRLRRPPLFIAFVLALLALIIVYVGDRLIPDAWPFAARAVTWATLASVVFAPLLALISGTRRFALALSPLGLFIFLLTFTVLRDLAWLVVRLFSPPEGTFEASSLAVVLLALATFVFATVRAGAAPRVVDVDVPVVDLDPALHGFTIAQLSDVHIGRTLGKEFLAGVVDTVNAMNPDLIAITGDLVDGGVEQLREHTSPLRDLRARHGAFFVTGNHDYYSGALPWIAELKALGVKVLVNAHHVLDHDGGTVVVGGVTDHSANGLVQGHESDPHKAAAGSPDAFRLLLAHQPASGVEAERAGFDLQLSGHTHGGQFFPGTLFAHLVFPFVAGLHRLGAMWIYTSSGTGYVGPPLRTVRSEVTRLRLVRA